MSNSKKTALPALAPDERQKLLAGLLRVAVALQQAGHPHAVRWLVLRAINPLRQQEAAWQKANATRHPEA